MLNVMTLTAPIFILLALGFVAARREVIPTSGLQTLGAFVLNIAIPALIIQSLASMPLGRVINGWFMLIYALGNLLILGLVFTLCRHFLKRPVLNASYLALGAAFPNSIAVGFPLLSQVMTETPKEAFAMALIVENLLLLPLGIFLLEHFSGRSENGESAPGFVEKLINALKTPLMAAIGVGLLLSLLSVQLPSVIDRSLSLLATTVSGVSLFYGGAVLAKVSSAEFGVELALVAFAKLIIHPLVVVALILLLPSFDPVLQASLVILCLVPMFGLYPVIGSRYGLGHFGASALLLTTAASFVTVAVGLFLLQCFGFLSV